MILLEALQYASSDGLTLGVEERFAYDAASNITYQGTATYGTATNNPIWRVIGYTVDAQNRVTRVIYFPPNQNWNALTGQ
jgi:hypothetical protein